MILPTEIDPDERLDAAWDYYMELAAETARAGDDRLYQLMQRIRPYEMTLLFKIALDAQAIINLRAEVVVTEVEPDLPLPGDKYRDI